MRLNRGCGCLLLVLAAGNLLYVIGAIVGMSTGNVSVGMGMLALALFGANLVASAMLGVAGYRRAPIGGGAASSEADVAEGEAGVEDGEVGRDEGIE